MANRIILGKSTNSNLGHSGGKFGLYISRPGDDVTNCTKDQLIFNTDNVGSVSGAIDLGQFQVVPTSGTNATASVSASAGATASISHIDIGGGHLLFNKFIGSYADSGGQDSGGSSSINKFLNGDFSSGTGGSLTNIGNAAIVVDVAVFKGFSTGSLF